MTNVIALVDCDSFFVSCEQAENPKLLRKPVCVVSGENGCVISRSREAKIMGVKMGEPCFMARKEFPDAIYISARNAKYAEYSQNVMQCLQNYTTEVEVCSIDEAFMNLNGLDKLYEKSTEELVKNIRQTVYQKCNVPVSIGVSSSKILAKLGSDKAKNCGGIFVIKPEEIEDILGKTPIEDVCGFGRQNTIKMKMNGIFNCKEFVANTDTWVRKNLGINGLNLKYELLGYMVNKVSSERTHPKSIQKTAALSVFTDDIDILRASIKYHVHCTGRKMRSENCYCQSVGVLLRTKDFQEISICAKTEQPTNSEREIFEITKKLLKQIYRPHVLYRSSGVMLEHFIRKEEFQPNLFAVPEYVDDKISRVVDELEKKFGKDIIKNGLF